MSNKYDEDQFAGFRFLRPKVLLVLAAALLLLYALLWGYRFVVSQLGPFAQLALVVLAAILLALVGPWLVVHERRQIRHGIICSAEWLWTHAGLHQRNWVSIAAKDRGIGIPAAALPHLFTRFFRAQNAEAHHLGGMGIGLSVVKEIVTLHGGEVQVESRVYQDLLIDRPGVETESKVVQANTHLHHHITRSVLPQPNRIFGNS